VRAIRPVRIFPRQARLDRIFANPGLTGVAPLLEVLVPLHAREGEQLVGVAQFIIEGRSIVTEFAELDRHLNVQAALAFLSGSTILALGLGWAFHRMQRANRLLKARTEELAQANEELALALKTSAIGSVTSHLLHGLKNPLAGLQLFVATRGGGKQGAERWDQAEAAAQRMNAMIYDVLGLLREQSEWDSCDVSVEELCATVKRRTQAEARERGVELLSDTPSERKVASRTAQLVSLILNNLVENAIQATPAGKAVRLCIRDDQEGLCCEVQDEGPGIPAEIEARLFLPGGSTKASGTGLGLAICKQLAKHLGAELTLRRNSAAGCVFALVVPHRLLVDAAAPAVC
jgi:signal transduction histidine kinase